MQWLRHHGIRRGLAALIIMVGGLAIVSTGLYFAANSLFSQINALSSNLARSRPSRINEVVNSVRRHFVNKPSTSPNETAQAAPGSVAASAPHYRRSHRACPG